MIYCICYIKSGRLTGLPKTEGYPKIMKKLPYISPISWLHLAKLILRSLLLIGMTTLYVLDRYDIVKTQTLLSKYMFVPIIVWAVLIIEMVLRFFPSKFESMGCQKQFARNFEPTEESIPTNQSGWTTALVAGVWLLLNAVIGALYLFGVYDYGVLVIISLCFSVCDIICILYFCPFQTWFMKNRCCTTCRIYNWDFAMMFTPLVFIPKLYTYSLLGCALILLLRWEITYRLHPERFSSKTNDCLDCKNCKEKLCSHKKQLRSFIRKYRDKLFK